MHRVWKARLKLFKFVDQKISWHENQDFKQLHSSCCILMPFIEGDWGMILLAEKPMRDECNRLQVWVVKNFITSKVGTCNLYHLQKCIMRTS
jgi:hypothetical protein